MYTPLLPPQSPEELLPYLDSEFVKVSREINNLVAGEYEILYNPPPRIKPGMVVYADGTSWNPGSGEGLYRRTLSNTWVFIG